MGKASRLRGRRRAGGVRPRPPSSTTPTSSWSSFSCASARRSPSSAPRPRASHGAASSPAPASSPSTGCSVRGNIMEYWRYHTLGAFFLDAGDVKLQGALCVADHGFH
nr:unnamed protein product [Digitaria exilis]